MLICTYLEKILDVRQNRRVAIMSRSSFAGNTPFHIACFLTAFGEMTLITGLPFFAIAMGAGPLELGVLGAVGMGVYTVSCLSLSRWVDRIRPKIPVMFALALACLVAFSASAARTVGYLILVAGLNGLLMAWYWPLVMTWLGCRSADTDLTRQLGIFNLSWSSGVPLGTLSAGLLFEIRPGLPFYVAAFMLLSALLVIAGIRRRSRSSSSERISGVPVGRRDGDEHSGKRYFLYLSWLSMLAGFFTIGNLRFQLPKRAIDAGMGESEIALFLFVMSLAQLIVFFLFSRSEAWQFRFRYMFLAHLATAVSMFLVFWSLSRPSLFIAFLLSGVGNGIRYFSSLYYGMVFRNARGRNTAIHESTIGAGFLSGAFGGGLIAERWGLASPYLACFGLICLAGCMWVLAAWRARSARVPPPALRE